MIFPISSFASSCPSSNLCVCFFLSLRHVLSLLHKIVRVVRVARLKIYSEAAPVVSVHAPILQINYVPLSDYAAQSSSFSLSVSSSTGFFDARFDNGGGTTLRFDSGGFGAFSITFPVDGPFGRPVCFCVIPCLRRIIALSKSCM